MLIRLITVAVLALVLWLGTRRMKIVPSRAQVAFEYVIGFVRNNIVIDTLGEKDGKRFMPILMTMFFVVMAMNITGVVPPFLIPGTSVIGVPVVLAIVAYVLFIYAGVRKHSWHFFTNALFLPGVPWPLYFLLTPVELFSTFLLHRARQRLTRAAAAPQLLGQ